MHDFEKLGAFENASDAKALAGALGRAVAEVVPPLGEATGNHAVSHCTHGINVSAGIDMLGRFALFRGHVVARTHPQLGHG